MSHAATISSWGNSDVIRIPKDILKNIGLKAGDKIRIISTERGSIENLPETEHRRIKPERDISFEALFNAWSPENHQPNKAWPDDDMVGAEAEAWS